jgi:uncharacterized membrane protein (UPF0127 family)
VRPDRRWLVAGGAVALAVVAAIVLGVVADSDDDGPAAVATVASTTSTTAEPGVSTSVEVPSSTMAPLTATTSTAAPARVSRPPTTSSPVAPERCPRPASGSDFAGFSATEIVIENGSGSHRSCVLTADTSAQQRQGLMGQDDLDGYDGMIFRFRTAEQQSFWMRNTSIPLSIAFFDADGGFVSSADMDPCGDRPDCPSYPSRGPAKYALEVTRGRLPAVGATSDSRVLV